MSQRAKKASKGKGNKPVMNTGGHVVAYDRKEEPEVRVPAPQKVTGDVKDEKLKGLAKASPYFKKLKEKLPASKKDEKAAIESATESKSKKKKEKDKEVDES